MREPEPGPGPDGIVRRGLQPLQGGATELRALVGRTREVVLVALLIGGVTGLGVAGFKALTEGVLYDRLAAAPVWAQVVAPLAGLTVAWLALRFVSGGAGPATSDEYIKAVPDRDVPFRLRPVVGRLLASVGTLGGGGALGYEGPSLYLGGAVGVAMQRWLRRAFRGVDRRTAIVAGAAAGVAAIFKAPATGAIFAIEVPFQDDLARHSLMPALVGAASGYVAFAAVNGTAPLFPVSGRPPIDFRDLAGAALVGLCCGAGARLFAALVGRAKRVAGARARPGAVLAAGVVLGGLVVVSRVWFDGEALSLGSGYRAVEWSLDPARGLLLIAGLATVRAVATATTLGGGGAGGLFVPLVVQGALTGRLVGGLFGGQTTSLFVLVGIAAFLGAGYRVPLAGVMFVAEATGRPGFIVPGLIASVVSQLVMGGASVSAYQRKRRTGHIEQRAALPVAAVLSTDPATADPDDTVSQFFTEHVSLARRRAVPVVERGAYVGMVLLDDLLDLEPDSWAEVTIRDVTRSEFPTGAPDWDLGQALAAMVAAEVDHLPIVDEARELRGVVNSAAILDLEDLLDQLGPGSDRGAGGG